METDTAPKRMHASEGVEWLRVEDGRDSAWPLRASAQRFSCACPVRHEARPPAAAFVVTSVCSAALAYANGQVDTFPTELSRTANHMPSYLVFALGLTCTALLILVTYPRPPGLPARILTVTAAAGMVGLAWICDGCWQSLHQVCASTCFLSLLGVGWLRTGFKEGRGIHAAMIFYALLELARFGLQGVCSRLLRQQVMGAFQWATILSLLASL